MGSANSRTKIDNPEGWSWGVSEIQVEEFGFDWTLLNFLAFTPKQKIYSPTFRSAQSRHEWGLYITTHSIKDGVEYIGLFLDLVKLAPDTTLETLALCFEFILINEQGRVLKSIVPRGVEIKVGAAVGFHHFYRRSDLFRELRPMSGPLTVRCRVQLSGQVTEESGPGLAPSPFTGISNSQNERKDTKGQNLDLAWTQQDKSSLLNLTPLPPLKIDPWRHDPNYLLK